MRRNLHIDDRCDGHPAPSRAATHALAVIRDVGDWLIVGSAGGKPPARAPDSSKRTRGPVRCFNRFLFQCFFDRLRLQGDNTPTSDAAGKIADSGVEGEAS